MEADDCRVIAARANKRVGLAVADSVYGPWKRLDTPILPTRPGKFDSFLTSNPAPCIREDGSVLLVYKARRYEGTAHGQMTLGAAEAAGYEGPYRVTQDTPLFPPERFHIEDPFIWRTAEGYAMIAKDMDGKLCGEKHGGILALSPDGRDWRLADQPKSYSRRVRWEDGSERWMGSFERPFLLFQDGLPTHLFAAVADGPGASGKPNIPGTWLFRCGLHLEFRMEQSITGGDYMGETVSKQMGSEGSSALISESVQQWAEGAWQQIVNKVERTSQRIGVSFPHASVNGVYDNMRPSWWTAGFWPGILWQIAEDGHHPGLQGIAELIEEKLDEPLYSLAVHHDAGFIWTLSAVADYRITGSERSKHRGLMAAAQLASRFNVKGSFIRAWHDLEQVNRAGWSIIDTVMNLPLLYWASEVTEDPRFRHIAAAHADTVLAHFLRPDGSSYHILEFDPESGERIGAMSGQGYAEESAWSRGSAWTIYGLTLSYIYTGEERFLTGAKRAAHFSWRICRRTMCRTGISGRLKKGASRGILRPGPARHAG